MQVFSILNVFLIRNISFIIFLTPLYVAIFFFFLRNWSSLYVNVRFTTDNNNLRLSFWKFDTDYLPEVEYGLPVPCLSFSHI